MLSNIRLRPGLGPFFCFQKRKVGVAPAVVLLAVLVWVLPPSGAAETDHRLEEIQAAVELEHSKLGALRERLLASEETLGALDQELKALRAKEAGINEVVSRLSEEERGARTEMTRLAAQIEKTRRLALRRLRALYEGRGGQALENLFLRTGSRNLVRNIYFLAKVKSFDQEMLKRAEQELAAYAVQQRRLAELLEERKRAQVDLQQQRQKIERVVRTQRAERQALAVKRQEQEASLIALQAQALRLETVVVSLTNGGEEPAAAESDSDDDEGSGPLPAFQGGGLDELRGRLPVPVSGRMVKPFGREKRAEFSDYVFHKGQAWNAGPEAEVRAVAAGRVIFAGHMPAYGKVVIVDHGQRCYSLYGRLAETRVKRGDLVQAEAELAALEDREEAALYFEIRKGGLAVDPAGYLRSQ